VRTVVHAKERFRVADLDLIRANNEVTTNSTPSAQLTKDYALAGQAPDLLFWRPEREAAERNAGSADEQDAHQGPRHDF
jgi:hypothetical protein